MMKKIFITLFFIFNMIVQWKNGSITIQSGQSLMAQTYSPQQWATYLNSLGNGNTYTYNGSTGQVFQHNGSGGLPSIFNTSGMSIPSTWSGTPSGPGFTNWVGNLAPALGSALNNFFSAIGGGGSPDGEDENEDFGWAGGASGWEPCPDGFGYDPSDPNNVGMGFMDDPMFNPGLSPGDQGILDDLQTYYDIYNGNYTVDCQGVVNGTAYLDSCGDCVGGTTGLLACLPDCAGVWNGASYLDSCNVCVDSIRKQPCDTTYKKIGDSLYNYLNKPEFTDSLNKFKQNTAVDTLEKAISLGQDLTSGSFKTTSIRIAPPGLAVSLIPSWPGMKIYQMVHFHPITAYATFSAGDFYTLQAVYANPSLNQIKSHYVFGAADSSFFAMAIEDSLLFSNYLNLHPIGATMNAITHDFDTTTNIGKDFDKVLSQLKLTMSDDDAYTQANAYVMSKYNMGLVLYRKKLGETTFKKINTKVTTNATGNETYSASNCL